MIWLLRELCEGALYPVIILSPFLSVYVVAQNIFPNKVSNINHIAPLLLWVTVGLLAFSVTGNTYSLWFSALGYFSSLLLSFRLKDYYISGAIFLILSIFILFFGAAWGVAFIIAADISTVTRSLLFLVLVSLVFTAPLSLVTFLPTQSYLFRRKWHRPREPLRVTNDYQPKVSIHLPCYSEPPGVVCAALEALSRMDYLNYEVIVIDNNTKDSRLWIPIKDKCAELGDRFRFFHVDSLEGAKAGALNFALKHTCGDATIIGVIDSDYICEPCFLRELVGFFEDPKMGFVQTPHDYFGWETNIFQRFCYWEYMPAYRLEIASLNEWIASYIIGTMCLVRRSVLESVDGWSEWCLTEDSECAVRLHASGYSSVYLIKTYGRGLIPEKFYEYRKQRLRWTIGPIQQIKRHWRLFLPKSISAPSKLSNWQRLFELSHSLREALSIITIVLIPIGLAITFSLFYHNELIVIPKILWVAFGLILPSLVAIRALALWMSGCRSILDMVGASIASLSLTHIRLVGSCIGCFNDKNAKWQRTNKFKMMPNWIKAIYSVGDEALISLVFFFLSLLVYIGSSVSPPDIMFLSSIGLFGGGVSYLASPVMAVIAEIEIGRNREAKEEAFLCSELGSEGNLE